MTGQAFRFRIRRNYFLGRQFHSTEHNYYQIILMKVKSIWSITQNQSTPLQFILVT